MSAFAGALGALCVFCAAFKGAYDLWASLAFVLASAAVLAAYGVRAAWSGEGVRPWPWISAAAAAAGFAASLASPLIPADSWTVVPSWIAAAAMFAVACSAFEDDADFDRFLKMLVPFFWAQAAFVLREQWISVPRFLDQSAGLLFDANASAAFHAAWIPPLAWRALRARRGGEAGAGFWLSGLGAALVGFAGAKSVWGWIALLAVLPWFLPERFGTRARRSVAAVAVFAAAWKFGGASDRLDWWWTGLRMFADAPLTGVGLGGYGGAFLAYRAGHGAVQTVSVHSAPVQLLAETGILGAGAFCWAAAAALRGRWRRAYEERRGAFLGAVSLAIVGAAGVCFEFPANLLSAALLAGAALGSAKEPRRPLRKAAAVSVAAACLAATPFLISPWQASRAVVSGQAALIRGDSASARRYFSAAGAMDPRSFEARRGLARVAFRERDAGEAVRLQREAIGRNPLNAVLWMELSGYLSGAGRDDESAEAIRRAQRLSAGLLQRPRPRNMSSMSKSP